MFPGQPCRHTNTNLLHSGTVVPWTWGLSTLTRQPPAESWSTGVILPGITKRLCLGRIWSNTDQRFSTADEYDVEN